MTEAEYLAARSILMDKAKYYSAYSETGAPIYPSTVTDIYREIDDLDRSYHAPLPSYTEDQIISILQRMRDNNTMTVSYGEYAALADYFAPYGGEDYIKSAGISYIVGR